MLWVSILLALYGLLFASEYLASSTSIHSFDSQRVFVWEAGSLAPDLVTLRLKVTKTRPYTVEPSQFNLLSTKHARYWLFRYMTAYACSTKPVFTFAKGIHLTRPYLNMILCHAVNCYQVSSRSMPIVGATVLESRVASEVVIRQADGGKVRLKSSTSGKWPAYHPNGHRNSTRRVASLRDRVGAQVSSYALLMCIDSVTIVGVQISSHVP